MAFTPYDPNDLVRRTPKDTRMMYRLRLALVLWIIFVVGVLFPPAFLALLLVPRYIRNYRRKITAGHTATERLIMGHRWSNGGY